MVTLATVVRRCGLRAKLVIISILYAVDAIVFFGLELNVQNLPGNKFLNFAILMLVRLPAGLSVGFLLERFGRIWPMVGFGVLAGLSSIAAAFIPRHLVAPVILVAALSAFAISCSFAIARQVCLEVFPTPVRAVCDGVAMFVSCLGTAVAPIIMTSSKIDKSIPILILGLIGLVGAPLGLFLPETWNGVLPESIADAEDYPVAMKAARANLKFNAFRRPDPYVRASLL